VRDQRIWGLPGTLDGKTIARHPRAMGMDVPSRSPDRYSGLDQTFPNRREDGFFGDHANGIGMDQKDSPAAATGFAPKAAQAVLATAKQPLLSIQYLRGIAAVAVVTFHQLQGWSAGFRGGRYGVDLFFIISGFIMIALTDGRSIGPKRFLIDRVARIVPPYWVATISAFVLTVAIAPLNNSSGDPALLLRSLFFIPDLNDQGHIWPTLYLGWTLNYEVFFYFIFSLCLLVGERSRLAVLGLALAALTAAGALLHPRAVPLQVYTSPLLLEFFIGAVLGRLYGLSLESRPLSHCLAWVLVMLVASGGIASLMPRLWIGVIAAALVTLALSAERRGLMPTLPFLKLMGDASFAIYLFQEFAFYAVDSGAKGIGVEPQDNLAVQLLNTACAIALGVLIFRFVERPITAFARRMLGRLFHERGRLAPAR
jgi:exopolysaccharide production protein ExoZ